MIMSKHNNKITEIDGIKFKSDLEARYYLLLKDRLEKSEIFDLVLQPKFELIPGYIQNGKKIRPGHYVADFQFVEKRRENGQAHGVQVVVDTKGFFDSLGKWKIKHFQYLNPRIEFRLISYSKKDGGWIDYYDLQMLRKERKKAKSIGNK